MWTKCTLRINNITSGASGVVTQEVFIISITKLFCGQHPQGLCLYLHLLFLLLITGIANGKR